MEKRYSSLMFILCLAIGLCAQPSRRYEMGFRDIAPLPEGGYMAFGSNDTTNILMRMDPAGVPVWTKALYTNSTLFFPHFQVWHMIGTPDSCCVMTGTVYDPVSSSMVPFCTKVSSSGSMLWKTALVTPGGFGPHTVWQTSDSGFVIAGSGPGPSGGPFTQMTIVKVNKSGTVQWLRSMYSGDNTNRVSCVRQTADGGFICGGWIEDYPPYDQGGALVKLSASGNVMWTRKYALQPGIHSVNVNDIAVLPDGFMCYINNDYHIAMMKTDLAGSVQWMKTYSHSVPPNYDNGRAPRLILNSDSSFTLITSSSGYAPRILRTDQQGNVLWTRAPSMTASSMTPMQGNRLLLTGTGTQGGGILFMDSLGDAPDCVSHDTTFIIPDTVLTVSSRIMTVATDVNSYPVYIADSAIQVVHEPGCVSYFPGMPEQQSSEDISVYPNPSAGIFNIAASGSRAGSLSILNVLGETVYCNNQFAERVKVDLTNEPAGIYFYCMKTADNKPVSGRLCISR